MVRRFVGSGHETHVLTSNARDLWYFTDRDRARLTEPPIESVDGARVHRFAVQHLPFQRYLGKALSFVPHWPTQCRYASYMPILPGLSQHREQYDCVVAVGFPFTVFSYEAYRLAKRCGAPLLITPFLHLATPGDRVHRHYTMPHQIRLLQKADTVVVVTKLEADAVASWGIPSERILRVAMGYNRSEVTGGNGASFREAYRIPTGRSLVGHLATLDPNKGTSDLVRAVMQLNDRRPADDPIMLLLAGTSSPDFERFAASLPSTVKPWLIQSGPLDPVSKADFFDAIDLFAMPSRTDSFGIVFLEAWANAKPVVAASAGGVAEVVAHDETGLLVSFGDVNRLALAIDWLVHSPDTAHRLGKAGQRRVSHGHSWDDCFAALSTRVETLVEMNRADRSQKNRSAVA